MPTNRRFEDKVVVVTGGASGIGLGIGRAFSNEGATIVVADVDVDAAAAEAAAHFPEGRGFAIPCDVTERASVEALADQAWSRFGHVDVMVNNAGVFPPLGPLIDADEENIRWVLEVNVIGVWHGCSVFGQRLVEQGTPANIVNTGSENSLGMPHTFAGIYTASKHAVLGLSDVLRHELPEFVKVSVLCPGMVPSRLGQAVRNRQDRFGGALDIGGGGNVPDGLGMSADDVGRRVVDGVSAGEFYIVTHPPVREIVDERYEEISGAFARQAPRFDGDELMDTRALLRRAGR